MFEYEQEVRVIVTPWTQDPNLRKDESGFRYPIDTAGLPDAIRIHPEADQSFMETVVAVVGSYAPVRGERVTWSAIRERPPLGEVTISRWTGAAACRRSRRTDWKTSFPDTPMLPEVAVMRRLQKLERI
jgi:hypothetical protein